MIKVAIIGGSGYTGGELIRLLLQHPYVTITSVTSERSAGKTVAEVFPNLKTCTLRYEPFNVSRVVKKADLFFLCLPHKTAQAAVANLHKAGKTVIDLSADYRLKSAALYRKWYETAHRYPALLKKAVYGLPEINRERIRGASVIANPGCYPASAILGLAPALKAGLCKSGTVIVDAKSGVSGAGRNPVQSLMFSEASESVKAYSVGVHRHTPEIEQEVNSLTKKPISVVFTPHLIPMDRGILSTIYVQTQNNISNKKLHRMYKDYYRNEPFIRVLDMGAYPTTKAVRGSNYCDISVFVDVKGARSRTVIIVSALDNLLKGASGLAVQNMNIMCGFDETTALTALSPCP